MTFFRKIYLPWFFLNKKPDLPSYGFLNNESWFKYRTYLVLTIVKYSARYLSFNPHKLFHCWYLSNFKHFLKRLLENIRMFDILMSKSVLQILFDLSKQKHISRCSSYFMTNADKKKYQYVKPFFYLKMCSY